MASPSVNTLNATSSAVSEPGAYASTAGSVALANLDQLVEERLRAHQTLDIAFEPSGPVRVGTTLDDNSFGVPDLWLPGSGEVTRGGALTQAGEGDLGEQDLHMTFASPNSWLEDEALVPASDPCQQSEPVAAQVLPHSDPATEQASAGWTSVAVAPEAPLQAQSWAESLDEAVPEQAAWESKTPAQHIQPVATLEEQEEQETLEPASATPTVPDQPHTYQQAHGTCIVVRAMLGIGKKPFLRGQGPGLSWNKGVAMEFVEAGQWRWTAPDSSQPIICRVYKNDECPADGEALCLQPGEQLEASPTFRW